LEDEEERNEIKEKIDAILKSLTPRQKEIIYLRFLQQMEYDEIAKIMNMSEQAARNLLHRALENARKNNTGLVLFILLLVLYSKMPH
jgi:RNA polymerase sigma factor (sigma-70 family)